MFIGDMFNEDNFHAGDNAWSSEHDQWAKESIEEGFGSQYCEQLAQETFNEYPDLDASGSAEEVLDAGWKIAASDMGVKKARYLFAYDEDFASDFVSAYAWLQQGGAAHVDETALNLKNPKDDLTAKRKALQDLAATPGVDQAAVQQRKLDLEREAQVKGVKETELDEYKGAHDKITFEVDSEKAYNHVMDKYGHVIDWDGDYMTVPARYWPAVQELAFAAGGDVQEIELNESAICPVCGCTPCNCTHIVKEGASVQDVFNAITYRIERQMPELFTDYGVELVADAIRDVAEFHEGTEELGSSDVGGMVREVVRQLKHQELRKSLDEVKKMSTQAKFEKHLAKHGYDVNAKQKYWDQKIKDIDAQIAAWDAEMERRKQGVAEEYDPSYDPDYRPYQKPEQDPDAWKQERDLEEPAAPTTVTIRDEAGNVVLQFPSTGGYYGDVRYALSKGFDTERGDYDIKWQKNTNEGNYWNKLQQERFVNEHKTALSMLNELNDIFKDK